MTDRFETSARADAGVKLDLAEALPLLQYVFRRARDPGPAVGNM